jgi:hypothetical protein
VKQVIRNIRPEDWSSCATLYLIEVKFMRLFVLLYVALVSSVSAQEPPYANLPAAAPPYYRVRYEGSTQAGELVYPVSFTIWIPPHVKTLRGLIIHQHGCGEGSCTSGWKARVRFDEPRV